MPVEHHTVRLSKQPYPVTTLNGLKHAIDPTPDYQRPPAWNLKQKQLLIDSILRGYDVPKMYWHRLPRGVSVVRTFGTDRGVN